MDELTLLRELDAEVPVLDARARQDARRRLESVIERPPARRSSRRQWISRNAGALVLALTVAVALVVVVRDIAAGGNPDPSYLRLADPAPEVLELAASGREVIGLTPTARPDQFLYTRSITKATPVGPEGTRRTFVDENWGSIDRDTASWRSSELGRTWDGVGGTWGPPRTAEGLAQIPRDPRRLLLLARAWQDPSPPSGPFTEFDWMNAYDFLFMLLNTPLIVPPDLRAAAVTALAYTPDARVVDEQLEFRGRPAAVIDIPQWGSDIIVDRYTHEPLGARRELGPADMNGRNGRLFNASRVRLVSYFTDTAIVDRIGQRP